MSTDAARLLVVDDEPAIRELLTASLSYAGFAVETADDGVAALNAVARNRPDLVVLDVLLPGIAGFEVARTLRARGDGLPVLFLTSLDGIEDRICGLTLAGDDHLTEPFSLEELRACIRAVLRRTSEAAAPAQLRFADLVLRGGGGRWPRLAGAGSCGRGGVRAVAAAVPDPARWVTARWRAAGRRCPATRPGCVRSP